MKIVARISSSLAPGAKKRSLCVHNFRESVLPFGVACFVQATVVSEDCFVGRREMKGTKLAS